MNIWTNSSPFLPVRAVFVHLVIKKQSAMFIIPAQGQIARPLGFVNICAGLGLLYRNSLTTAHNLIRQYARDSLFISSLFI